MPGMPGYNWHYFSGNEVYWKTRWEDNIEPWYVIRKEQWEKISAEQNAILLPHGQDLWRDGDPATYPGSDGVKPENETYGTSGMGIWRICLVVPDTYKGFRFWRNTSVATLGAGQIETFPAGTLGYEFAFEQPAFETTYPKGRIALSSTANGGQTQKLSFTGIPAEPWFLVREPYNGHGALDGTHDLGNDAPSADMQQATVNLFADMGVQPLTLQAGLIPATASTDLTKPFSIIISPMNGVPVQQNNNMIITGT